MTVNLRLLHADARIIVAAIAQLHSDGLDQAMRHDEGARSFLVGLRDWQTDVAYPARAEIAITLNAWIRALVRSEGDVAIAIPEPRLYITLAALARFARQCQVIGNDAMAGTARILDGTDLGLATTALPTPSAVSRAFGRLITVQIGRAIAA